MEEIEHRELLAQALPGIKVAAVRLLQRGNDKTAVLVNNRHVVRIAHDAETGARMRAEHRVLAALKGKVRLRIPEIAHCGETPTAAPKFFDVYDLIPGVWLTNERLRSMSPSQREHLGRQLGEFMGEMHRAAGSLVPAMTPASWPPPLARIVESLRSLKLDAEQWSFIERVERAAADLERRADDVCVVHDDVGGHNLACDVDAGRVVGIFDFSEAGTADRHQEMQYLPGHEVPLTRWAMDEYARVTGVQLDAHKVETLHLVNSLAHAAHRRDPTWVLRREPGLAQG